MFINRGACQTDPLESRGCGSMSLTLRGKCGWACAWTRRYDPEIFILAFLVIRVEFKDFKDGLRVFGVVFASYGRRCQETRPLFRKTL
jgi:hypothetical protein